MTVGFALSVLCDPMGFFPEAVRIEARKIIQSQGSPEEKKMGGRELPFKEGQSRRMSDQDNTMFSKMRLGGLPSIILFLLLSTAAFAQPAKKPLAISDGGTGAYLAEDALQNLGASFGLWPTQVYTATYTASSGDSLVRMDNTVASDTVLLPIAPSNGTREAVKLVTQGGSHIVTVLTRGSDVYNKPGGGISATLQLLNQAIVLNYKSSDHTWTVVSTDVPLAGIDSRYLHGFAIFGDSSDGALIFDGSTTILGIAPSANAYTLTRDIYASTMTVNNGITINCAGFRIFARTSLTNNGNINHDGTSASGTIAGVGTAGTLSGGGTGGAGRTTSGNGTASAGLITHSLGGNGATGGGDGASATGGAGTAVTAAITSDGSPHSGQYQAISGRTLSSATLFNGGSGGGGGALTILSGSPTSGAGGSGGGALTIAAQTITNNGTISCNGGAGSSAALNGGTGNGGAGGGGGGGWIALTYNAITLGAVTVNVGASGSPIGTGAAASGGAVGTIFTIQN